MAEAAAAAAVEVRASPLGAEGLFALRHIAPEEDILVEKPLVALPRKGEESMRQVHEMMKEKGDDVALVSHGGLWLGDPEGEHNLGYWEWAERCLSEDVDRKHAVNALLALSFNCYASTETGMVQMVYPTISKANHSCAPNAVVCCPEEGAGSIVAILPIAPGDEVVVSYLSDEDLAKPSPWRRRRLSQNWEFACGCGRCNAAREDVRRFSCPRCGACSCLPPREEDGGPQALACERCGAVPGAQVAAAWQEEEKEVEGLLEGMPESLYSAWAPSEDFANAHPEHWLSCLWKWHLTVRTELDAQEAERDEDVTAEEAAELWEEAKQHRETAVRCRRALLKRPEPLPLQTTA